MHFLLQIIASPYCEVCARPLSEKQNDISVKEENLFFLQYPSGFRQQINNNLQEYQILIPRHTRQPKALINYDVFLKNSRLATNPRTKLSKRSTETLPINYHDKEAYDIASEIVQKYFTMRQAGVGHSNPIMDKYFSNGKINIKVK